MFTIIHKDSYYCHHFLKRGAQRLRKKSKFTQLGIIKPREQNNETSINFDVKLDTIKGKFHESLKHKVEKFSKSLLCFIFLRLNIQFLKCNCFTLKHAFLLNFVFQTFIMTFALLLFLLFFLCNQKYSRQSVKWAFRGWPGNVIIRFLNTTFK